jgi:hypothetical protein
LTLGLKQVTTVGLGNVGVLSQCHFCSPCAA